MQSSHPRFGGGNFALFVHYQLITQHALHPALRRQPNRVDDAAAGGAFAAGGEEGGGGVGVDAGDLDAGGGYSAALQEPGIGTEEVDVMAAGHGAAVAWAPEAPDLLQGEVGGPETLHDFLSDLEAVRADGRPDDGAQVRRPAPERALHQRDGLLRDLQHGAFPAGMDGRGDVPDRIVEEDRHTVGRPDPEGHSRQRADKCVVPLQVLPRQAGPVDDGDPVPVDLVPLYDRIRQDRVPPRREGLRTLSEGISQKAAVHAAKIRKKRILQYDTILRQGDFLICNPVAFAEHYLCVAI